MSAVVNQPEPEIRPMREHDLARIHAIERRSYQFPWSVGVFSDCLRVGYSCWALEYEESIRGYGIMSVAAQECHILNVCVDPTSRRHGFANVILAQLLRSASEHDAVIAFLEVRPSNVGAIEL